MVLFQQLSTQETQKFWYKDLQSMQCEWVHIYGHLLSEG